MDPYEATRILLSKIKTLDPENASKIMGYILIQDLCERDLLRLAFGPETLLRNVIIKAKTQLGLSPNTLATPSTPSSPSPLPLNPISRPSNNQNPFSQSSPRVTGDGPFVDFGRNPTSNSWPVNNNNIIRPKSSPFLSYDNIRAGSSLLPPFSKNGGGDCSNNGADFFDEYQLDEYLSFLDDSSSRNEEFVDPRVQLGGCLVNNGDTHLHRRRFSESDVCFGNEDEGFGIGGYRPCMYFARGFCKNGDNCKFVHGSDNVVEDNGGGVIVGSPREMESLYLQQQQQEEMLRMKAAQQQRVAYNKYMNFLLQQQNEPQRLGAAAGMVGDEFHKFARLPPERNEFLAIGMAEKATSASRQIYLTFPADSTFKDEDVSNYFNTFGLVQDVRIPYQQKRMFGFVTFVHPETVKIILARGNPHFICDSRVLVKPYKEKGKVANDRRQQQHLLESRSFSACSSPSGLHPRELHDFHMGARMLYNTHEMMTTRRKLEEQAELQQAIELQGRRLINLQLREMRGDYVHHHQRSLSVDAPISMPIHASVNQTVVIASDGNNREILEDNGDSSAATVSPIITASEQNVHCEVNTISIQNSGTVDGDKSLNPEGCNVQECLRSNVEHVLPDSLFASPIKSSGNQHSNLSSALSEVKESNEFFVTSSENNASIPVTSTSDVASY